MEGVTVGMDLGSFFNVTTAAIMDDTERIDLKFFILDALKVQTAEIVSKMDTMNTEVKELHSKTADILDSVNYNAEQIENNTSEIDNLKSEMSAMRKDFEVRLLTQEMYSRKSNLLLYGIPDDKDLEEAAKETFSSLSVKEANNMIFVNVHRFPRNSRDPKNFRASM